MGDLVAVIQAGGVVAQFGPPAEILASPASEFVARFVGADRGLKRLSLFRVGELELSPAATARPGERRRPHARAARGRPVRLRARCSTTSEPADRLGRPRPPRRRGPVIRGPWSSRRRRCSTAGRRSRTRSRCCSTPTSRRHRRRPDGRAPGLITVDDIAALMRETDAGRRDARAAADAAAGEPPTADDGVAAAAPRRGRPDAATRPTVIDWAWIADHLDEILLAIWQHMILVIVPLAVGFAIASGSPSGPSAGRRSTARSPRSPGSCTRSRASPRSRSLVPDLRVLDAGRDRPADHVHAADLRSATSSPGSRASPARSSRRPTAWATARASGCCASSCRWPCR